MGGQVTMRLRFLAVFCTLALVMLAEVAVAADRVPTKERARSWFLAEFPKAAPKALLRDQRALVYRTKRGSLRVPLEGCRRTRRQVECGFRVRLVPRRKGERRAPRHFGPINSRGELWGKLRDGKMIGRVGDYRCRAENADD